MLPKIVAERGRLFAQSPRNAGYLAVDRVVFHGIFERDLDFLAGLALWGGPCFPDAGAMMECRLRLPCLVRALRHTRFGGGPRGYASPGAVYSADAPSVAKWGDWHCGENKARFDGDYAAEVPTLVEPFVAGEAVRVVALGSNPPRQIRMAGPGWLKSAHGPGAEWVPLDADLASDTLAIKRGLGLNIIATDYILGESGPYLLEVNHIPSVTCLPGLWDEYTCVVAAWAAAC